MFDENRKDNDSIARTYYLTFYYTYLIEAISNVYGKDKGQLLLLLFNDKKIDEDEVSYVNTLPFMYKHEVIERALMDIFQLDFSDLSKKIQKSHRLQRLQDKITDVNKLNIFEKKRSLTLRISSDIEKESQTFIKQHKLKPQNIVELSIDYFLMCIAEQDFHFIYLLFAHKVELSPQKL